MFVVVAVAVAVVVVVVVVVVAVVVGAPVGAAVVVVVVVFFVILKQAIGSAPQRNTDKDLHTFPYFIGILFFYFVALFTPLTILLREKNIRRLFVELTENGKRGK